MFSTLNYVIQLKLGALLLLLLHRSVTVRDGWTDNFYSKGQSVLEHALHPSSHTCNIRIDTHLEFIKTDRHASTPTCLCRHSSVGISCLASAARVPASKTAQCSPVIHKLTIVIQLYPSADSIIVLDAHDFLFRRALAFWEAFPGTRHLNIPVKCLAIDSGMKLVRRAHN